MGLYKTYLEDNCGVMFRRYIFKCDSCNCEVYDSWPRYEGEDGTVYCPDCAFKLGLISDKDWMQMNQWAPFERVAVKDGKIYAVAHREKFPWEKKDKDYRHCSEYENWRKKVFERDNYTCQKCGQHGGQLEAHHIYRFKYYPTKRFDVKNGITLCKKCHKLIHKTKDKKYLKG